MASINLIEAFQEFKDAENIDRPTMMKVVEDVFKTLLRKKYGSDENFDVIVNAEKGDLEIIRRRMIVEDGEVLDPLAEVGYSDAVKIEPDFEVGGRAVRRNGHGRLRSPRHPGCQTNPRQPYQLPEEKCAD